MRTAFAIASRDFRQFFASPKGAVLLWFMTFLGGVLFWSFLQSFVATGLRVAATGGEAPTLEQLARVLFANVNFLLLLVTPAVTMQLFAEERRSQSIRLLLSSPVTPGAIVMGKYVAALAFMSLVLMSTAVLPLFMVRYGTPDMGVIAASYLGLWLCLAAQIAFGTLVSAMTGSQITSFLLTLVGLLALMIVKWAGPDLAHGGIGESVMNYFAMTPHVEGFLKGRVAVSDVAYFVLGATLCLGLTRVVLIPRRCPRDRVVAVLLVMVVGGAAIVSNRPRINLTADWTRGALNTLSDQTRKVIDRARRDGEPIMIEGFFQDQSVRDAFRDTIGLYVVAGAPVRVTYIDPQADPARTLSRNIASANTAIFTRGNRETRVTTFSEERVTNALVHVMKDGSKSVYFTRGHGEGDPKGEDATGFSALAENLGDNRYEVKSLRFTETGVVPKDADLIVIAGPKYDLSASEIDAIRARLRAGVGLIVMTDAVNDLPRLRGLVAEMGARINDDLVLLSQDDARVSMFGQNNAIVADFDQWHPVSRDFAKASSVAVVMPGARSVEAIESNSSGLKATVLGRTAERFARVRDVRRPADLESIPNQRVDTGVYGMVIAMSGKPQLTDGSVGSKESRIVVFGSSAFANNQGIAVGQNRDLVVNAVNWTLQDEDYISIRPRDPARSTIDMTSPASEATLSVLCFLYPFVILGGGLAHWLLRRKR